MKRHVDHITPSHRQNTMDAKLIPRDVLFGNPQRAQARLSPDGKWLSFLAPVDGVLNVWVGPADDISQGQAGHRGKSPPDPQPQLGLRLEAHPLSARQERRRELPSLRHERRHRRDQRPHADRRRAGRDAGSQPEVSRRNPRRPQRPRPAATTTSGGSTSTPARRSSCSRIPASPAISPTTTSTSGWR